MRVRIYRGCFILFFWNDDDLEIGVEGRLYVLGKRETVCVGRSLAINESSCRRLLRSPMPGCQNSIEGEPGSGSGEL